MTVTLLAMIAHVTRVIVGSVVLVLAIACVLDWLVRTRRLNPFHPAARFARNTVDPLLKPLEGQIVRAGGTPSSAPLWALGIAVVVGILLISFIDLVVSQIAQVWFLLDSGPRGVFMLLVHWTFLILRVALIVRVVVSWLPVSPYSPWVRWAFVLTEPILRPLRQVVPTLGMFDITPIIAYFLLQILEWAFLSFHL